VKASSNPVVGTDLPPPLMLSLSLHAALRRIVLHKTPLSLIISMFGYNVTLQYKLSEPVSRVAARPELG
jgi:hypothetical protein